MNDVLFFKKPFPQVMGIINLAPSSFSEVGRCLTTEEAFRRAMRLVDEGADLLDIGAEPTNPRQHAVISLEQELDAILPVITAIRKYHDIPISIDTSKSEVIKFAVEAGANMMNDVRALRESDALQTVVNLGIPVCLMHMSHPNKQVAPHEVGTSFNGMSEVKTFLAERVHECLQAGVRADHLVIDPGIGSGSFGKNKEQNIQLIRELEKLRSLNCPIMVGVSRKSFLGELLNIPVEKRLSASVTAGLLALQKGASLLRVHDVAETVQALRVYQALS